MTESPEKPKLRRSKCVARLAGECSDSDDMICIEGMDAAECKTCNNGEENFHWFLSDVVLILPSLF